MKTQKLGSALLLGAAAVPAMTAVSCGSGTAPERKPNVIFILMDDAGYGDFGCYGQTRIETPNIDSLAVGETENPRFSRITITTHGDDRVINQIKLQLAKLEDVKAVVEIPEEQLFIREVVLIKAEPKKAQMEAFEQAVSDFGGRHSARRKESLLRQADAVPQRPGAGGLAHRR